ncbi:hypothetical protein NDU88_010593 [Pleurodeles waltl]|uniref:Uncharacterized protein n=1 Tax=Pleurodeles waltl TaxID=8319 RepID=A0AAV7PVB9_PLEWA|nr:hypothetical protein NDU88_010593 [Pleurodeles waltl]
MSSAARAYLAAQRSQAPSVGASPSVRGVPRRSGGSAEHLSKWLAGRWGLPDWAAGGAWGTREIGVCGRPGPAAPAGWSEERSADPWPSGNGERRDKRVERGSSNGATEVRGRGEGQKR